jgi:LAO/AO transport system kinase
VAGAGLAARAIGGDRRALARLVSLVEDDAVDLSGVIARMSGASGEARIIGVTGPPGAGKSTLVGALVDHLRARSLTVGVVAVDPSSVRSGGAVLGDRVRMLSRGSDPGVLIRSVSSRGHLGGLGLKTLLVADLMAAAGRDVVLVETVGVGQSEVEVATLVDAALVVLAPGFGDEVQSLKAGLMEIADLFVVNKADDPRATALAAQLRASSSPPPRTALCTATTGEGVAGLWEAVDALLPREEPAGRRARGAERLSALLRELAIERFRSLIRGDRLRESDALAAAVREGRLLVNGAVEALMRLGADGAAMPGDGAETGSRDERE